MADTGTGVLSDLGRRARAWVLETLGALFPESGLGAEPELVPIPVPVSKDRTRRDRRS